MILIADSGSTKTHWRFLSLGQQDDTIETEGINPFHQRSADIDKILDQSTLPLLADKVHVVYFYGAGCNYEDKIQKVADSLKRVFFKARIVVNHDLLAAARSVCGYEEGIACILGTGSNCCYYDGKDLMQVTPSLGYILGDEGSGAYMGRKLLVDFLYKNLPGSLEDKFVEKYKLDISSVLDRVYTGYLPNRFLASFTHFVQENIKHPYMYGLVYENFYDFLHRHVSKYERHRDVKTHFVGSVSYYFQDILKSVAADLGVQCGVIIESPITGLITYHQRDLLNPQHS